MDRNIRIRIATENDSDAVLQIYAPYIAGTAITFECRTPGREAFRARMAEIQKQYPWLVCDLNGVIAGYAYASRFQEREAYNWSVSVSVYIKPEEHGKSIGKALYTALFEILKMQGYFNVYAGVTLPNIRSERLHESLGFIPAGVYHHVGYKLGGWHDVKWYELKIREQEQPPAEPQSINAISNTGEVQAIMEKAAQMIKYDAETKTPAI